MGQSVADRMAEKLYIEMLSSDPERVRGAIMGAFHWCGLHEIGKLGRVPERLLDVWVIGLPLDASQNSMWPFTS